jgi:hypothetical protein
MAELENQKALQTNNEKRNRIQNFLNTTKSNASKIHKEQQGKKIEDTNTKKIMAQKQKELKAKYTVVEKKKEQPRVLEVQPTKVDWKKVSSCQGISVPNERMPVYQDSDDEASGVDSEFEGTEVRTPEDLMKERAEVKSKMLQKFKQAGKNK